MLSRFCLEDLIYCKCYVNISLIVGDKYISHLGLIIALSRNLVMRGRAAVAIVLTHLPRTSRKSVISCLELQFLLLLIIMSQVFTAGFRLIRAI